VNHADILSIMQLDCFRILCMLNAKNLNNAEIARIIGAEESTVRYWKLARGRHPKDPHGRRLVALFELYYPNDPLPEMSADIHAQGKEA
jgi:DNA-binding transcriptional regulator YiaG